MPPQFGHLKTTPGDNLISILLQASNIKSALFFAGSNPGPTD
jgi:hypothetical protein